MAEETLNKAGLYLDELNKIRVMDPEGNQCSDNLKEECSEFLTKSKGFQNIVGSFLELIESLSKQVEQEKMKAIGSRNMLKSVERQQDVQKQQLHSIIAEKQIELERLRLEYEVLLKEEAEQKDLLQQFLMEH